MSGEWNGNTYEPDETVILLMNVEQKRKELVERRKNMSKDELIEELTKIDEWSFELIGSEYNHHQSKERYYYKRLFGEDGLDDNTENDDFDENGKCWDYHSSCLENWLNMKTTLMRFYTNLMKKNNNK